MATRSSTRYARLRAAGLCVNCRNPATTNTPYCDPCRTKRNARVATQVAALDDIAKQKRRFRLAAIRRKFSRVHGRNGRCRRCYKPSDVAYCAPCKRIRNDRRYLRAGRGGLRQHQKADKYARVTIGRMQYELGSAWVEAKDWVMDHLDVFDEAPDWALYLSRPFKVEDDFVDERTRN